MELKQRERRMKNKLLGIIFLTLVIVVNLYAIIAIFLPRGNIVFTVGSLVLIIRSIYFEIKWQARDKK